MKDQNLDQPLDQASKLPVEPSAAARQLRAATAVPSSKRRLLVSTLVGGSAATVLADTFNWKKPVVETVLLPAHAQSSPGNNTTQAPSVFNVPTFSGGKEFDAGNAAFVQIDFGIGTTATSADANATVVVNNVTISDGVSISNGDTSTKIAEEFATGINSNTSEPNYTAISSGPILQISQATNDPGDGGANGATDFSGNVRFADLADNIVDAIRPTNPGFTGGKDYVALTAATAEVTVPGYNSDNGNADGFLRIDNVSVDLGRSDLTAAEVATRIAAAFPEATESRPYSALADEDKVTFTHTTAGTAGNGFEITVQDGNYNVAPADA